MKNKKIIFILIILIAFIALLVGVLNNEIHVNSNVIALFNQKIRIVSRKFKS